VWFTLTRSCITRYRSWTCCESIAETFNSSQTTCDLHHWFSSCCWWSEMWLTAAVVKSQAAETWTFWLHDVSIVQLDPINSNTCHAYEVFFSGEFQTWILQHKLSPKLVVITFVNHITIGKNMIGSFFFNKLVKIKQYVSCWQHIMNSITVARKCDTRRWWLPSVTSHKWFTWLLDSILLIDISATRLADCSTTDGLLSTPVSIHNGSYAQV